MLIVSKIPRTLNLTVDPDIGDSWPDLPAEIESDIGHEKTKCSQVNTIISIRGVILLLLWCLVVLDGTTITILTKFPVFYLLNREPQKTLSGSVSKR